MPFSTRFRLVRAEDQTVVDVAVEKLSAFPTTAPTGGGFELRLTAPTGTIWVQFPPQQIIEYATPAPARPGQPPLVRAVQEQPIFTPFTDVLFAVTPQDGPISLSVAGLLEAMTRLPLIVNPSDQQRAEAGPAVSAEAMVAASEQISGPVGPRPVATRFSLPRRLAIRPPGPETRLIHAVNPVNHGGRVELWSSRMGVRVTGSARAVEQPVPVVFDALPRNPSPFPR